VPEAFDAGCEALLRGGAAAELLHWTSRTQQGLIAAARRRHDLRFSLVGLELWGRLVVRGEKPDALAAELLAAAR
jgi:hypothetical protein